MNYSSGQPDFTRKSSANNRGKKRSNFMPVIVVLLLVIAALVVGIIAISAKKKPDNTVIIAGTPTSEKGGDPTNGTEPDHSATLPPTSAPESPLNAYIYVEAGGEIPPASAFLKDPDAGQFVYYLTNTSQIDTHVCGIYSTQIQCGEMTYEAELIVRDTTPPSAETKNITVGKGAELRPEDFIISVSDATQVTMSFVNVPDTQSKGTSQVSILLKDAAENEATVTAELTVDADEVPPVIEAIAYREIFVGDTISYRQGLSATDDRGGEVSISIDSSGVNLKEPGTYQVVYIATDQAGNVATFVATVVVRDLSELETPEGKYSVAAMHRKFSKLLPEIINDSMSDIEKLYAIWRYVSDPEHLSYVSHSDKDSYVREAIRGLDEGTGDCFTFYSVMKAFMEEAGFETVDVHRMGGSTKHFWSMVKVNGEWYHIDACPRSESRKRYWYCFLRTDEELLNFGYGDENYEKINYYYQFDTSLSPKSGTVKLADALVNWDTGEIELKIY
ncbi:MAG: transglutaminase domain-containing protein [Clostridia bacterium]|nr:transglutaminase domain-containing protein [Clostridia bacterium]